MQPPTYLPGTCGEADVDGRGELLELDHVATPNSDAAHGDIHARNGKKIAKQENDLA